MRLNISDVNIAVEGGVCNAFAALEAAIRGTPDQVPFFLNSAPSLDGQYRYPDGSVHGAKTSALFKLRKSTSPVPVYVPRDPNAERIK